MKKIMLIVLVIICMFQMVGCIDLFDNNIEDEGELNNRGLKYYFDEEEYATVAATIDEDITYEAPEMKCESDKYIRIYKTENEILFIWLGKRADKINSSDVLTKKSKILTKYICQYANIETVDVAFNLDMIAEDTVNGIKRNKYTGTIDGINSSGIDVALKTSIYTFVVNKRPGCVLGLVLDKDQDGKKYNEVDTNTQVMINSMTAE